MRHEMSLNRVLDNLFRRNTESGVGNQLLGTRVSESGNRDCLFSFFFGFGS